MAIPPTKGPTLPAKKAPAVPAPPPIPAAKRVNPQGGSQVSTPAPRSQRQIPHDQIARRAYELWQQRCGKHGSDQDDWLRAERELSGGRRDS